MSELKTIDFIYFNFLFTVIFFFLSFMLEDLKLGFSITLRLYIGHMSHDAVIAMITQSYGYDETWWNILE